MAVGDRPERVRAFFGVELDETAREAAERAAKRLQEAPRSDAVRWVRPENYHVTLRFLGQVATERLPELSERVSAEVRALAPFDLCLVRLTGFPSSRHPRVIVIEVAPREPLAVLAEAIERASVACGFEPETRSFRGHVTLGRARERGPRVPELEIGSAPFRVDAFVLFQSVLARTGSRYTPLERIPLRGGAS